MKRFISVLLLLLCLWGLFVPGFAATGASDLQSSTSVQADGSCQVTLKITFRLEQALDKLELPLPLQAQQVQLNGSTPALRRTDTALMVTIPFTSAGEYTMELHYQLKNVVTSGSKQLLLTLPLLSGFSYPISNFAFTVTLPGDIPDEPSFSSGYHQENIESSLTCTVSGNTVSGFSQLPMKDHETLTMTLPVPPELFSQLSVARLELSSWDIGLLACALLAILYYLLSLMPRLPRRVRCVGAPDGISAGEVGSCLTGRGTDLTMLVLTWAQLGYLLVELDDNGRVLLHRRMEMGNERSSFEVRCYQELFGRKKTIDGTGYHYAQLHRRLSTKSPLLRQLFLPRSGNPRIFRLLCCGAAAFSGISMAISCTPNPALQTVLAIVFAVLSALAAYVIQAGSQSIPLQDRTPLLLAAVVSLVWLGAGLLSGTILRIAPLVLFQLLAGFAAAFGGKRSELGMRCLSQLLSLNRYMRTASNFDLQRLLQSNPNYFYELAPYALAMGVDKPFARRFGKLLLPECSFLVTHSRHQLTAQEWAARLREAAEALNARQKRLPYEKLLGR